jgi:hypothetical protein
MFQLEIAVREIQVFVQADGTGAVERLLKRISSDMLLSFVHVAVK